MGFYDFQSKDSELARRDQQEDLDILRAIADFPARHVDMNTSYKKRKQVDVVRDGNGNITQIHEQYIVEESGFFGGSFGQ